MAKSLGGQSHKYGGAVCGGLDLGNISSDLLVCGGGVHSIM